MQSELGNLEHQIFEHLKRSHLISRSGDDPLHFDLPATDGPGHFWRNEDSLFLSFWNNRYEWLSSHTPEGFPRLYTMQLGITASGSLSFSLDRPRRRAKDGMDLILAKDAEEELRQICQKFWGGYESTDDQTRFWDERSPTGEPTKRLDAFLQRVKREIDAWLDRYPDLVVANPMSKMGTSPYATKIAPSTFDPGFAARLANLPEAEIQETNNPMPFAVSSFEMHNWRGIVTSTVTDLPSDTKWIVLTGENGYGKSTVLKGICIGLWGDRDGNYNLFAGKEKAVIAMDYLSSGQARRRVTVKSEATTHIFFRDTSSGPSHIDGYLVAYGSARLRNDLKASSDRERLSEGAVVHLFDDKKDLLNIEVEMITSHAYHPKRFALLEKLFTSLIPGLAKIQVVTDAGSPYIEYIEKDEEDQTYEGVTINELASGFKNIIGFVGDFVMRLSTQFSDQNSADWEDLQGIVIIDELELHLHPTYQKILPQQLSKLFPKIQFIASTHSPIPLLGMPKETVVINIDRDGAEGITCQKLDVDFSTLLPNAILSSEIFGFEDIIADSANSLAEVETVDDAQAAKRLKEIKRKLKIRGVTR